MVLWEITLGTAYFLGLKRTYKLALKLQRRLISPRYPKTRQLVQSGEGSLLVNMDPQISFIGFGEGRTLASGGGCC